jgi:hypothetical protein
MRLKMKGEIRAGAIVVGVGIAAIAGYTLYAALPYLLGPAVSATAIPDKGAISISGKTARVSYVSINGAPVPLQEDGTFSVIRSFPPGYTAIEISAKDRFGRSLEKTLSLVSK